MVVALALPALASARATFADQTFSNEEQLTCVNLTSEGDSIWSECNTFAEQQFGGSSEEAVATTLESSAGDQYLSTTDTSTGDVPPCVETTSEDGSTSCIAYGGVQGSGDQTVGGVPCIESYSEDSSTGCSDIVGVTQSDGGEGSVEPAGTISGGPGDSPAVVVTSVPDGIAGDGDVSLVGTDIGGESGVGVEATAVTVSSGAATIVTPSEPAPDVQIGLPLAIPNHQIKTGLPVGSPDPRISK